jgi:hypothetical protein
VLRCEISNHIYLFFILYYKLVHTDTIKVSIKVCVTISVVSGMRRQLLPLVSHSKRVKQASRYCYDHCHTHYYAEYI